MTTEDATSKEQRDEQPIRYVLFVCNHNAGRSQMAQAFFERYGPEDVRAESAGNQPAAEIWPTVIEAMHEVGIRPGRTQAEETHGRDAIARRLGDHDGLRGLLPIRAGYRRRLGYPRPGWQADR